MPSKIGAFFTKLWTDVIVRGFNRIAEAIRGLVMIDGDVYFTSKRRDGSPRVFSLYFGLVGAILIGAFFSTLIFVTTRTISDYYINNVYMDAEHRTAREGALLSDLQNFINDRGITDQDAKEKLEEWIANNRYVFLSVYSDDDLLFSSVMEKPSDEDEEKPDDNEGDEEEKADEDDKEGGSGGIFYRPNAEELLQHAASLDLKTISDSKGQSLHVKIYDYSEYFQRDILSALSFVISMIALAAAIVEHFGKIIARIKRLQYDVNEVSGGHLEHPIVATGVDELTKLSYDIDTMRSSMLENIEKEREALQMNTELITSMSHDIRTPLTVLMGYMDIMKSDLPPEEMKEYILASEKTVQRLKQLSDDMFKYFRAFGKGAEGITMEEYDATTLFEQLLTEHVLLLTESGYKVNYNIDEVMDGKSIVRTDAPHMMRIVDNIFSNLYKYADIDEEVSIVGRRDGDLAIFEFKNTVTKNKTAESSKVGLKTCKRLASYILNSFDWGEEDGVFTLTLSLRLCEEGTKISESVYIR
jgi:signal transduction histidine kinase